MSNKTTIKFHPVKSSQIKEVAHEPIQQKLYVRFINGDKLYSYTPVSSVLFEKFMKAESPGKFFYSQIR